ncbi:MAG TPA: hypothetical protein VES42_04120 [Pilimelia sp.]|nr:hypothetical protein [Pilimelia sp.]
MQVSDTALRYLGSLDPAEVRVWLRQHQPVSDVDKRFWWEIVTTRALQGMYQSTIESERHAFARLASVATAEAMDQAMMGKCRGAIRIANLAASYFAGGGGDAALFDVNSTVALCLDLIEVPLDLATEQVRDLRALPIERVRALRDAKNLIAACVPIANRLTDQRIIDRLSDWLHLQNDLP